MVSGARNVTHHSVHGTVGAALEQNQQQFAGTPNSRYKHERLVISDACCHAFSLRTGLRVLQGIGKVTHEFKRGQMQGDRFLLYHACIALYSNKQLACGIAMWTVSISVWYEGQELNWI